MSTKSTMLTPSSVVGKNYFLDEAGDTTLLDKHHKKVIVGTPGCSKFLMLGMLDVADPLALSRDMERLRQKVCGDSKYPTEPASEHRKRNTALLFHAKNDHPLVRNELYSLLLSHDIRFFAVVTDKLRTYNYHRRRKAEDPGHSYTANLEYDFLVRCLFTHRLHGEETYDIHFANRGLKDRTRALERAVRDNREWYLKHYDMDVKESEIKVHGRESSDHAGLQAVDYMLWALQRFYETKNSDYLEKIWPKCSLINDRDLPGRNKSGVYFERKDPLSLAGLLQARGI